VTKNLEGGAVEEAYRIDDQTALTIIHHLLREEGLFVGLSSGINLARERGPKQVITTILCDSGIRNMSKIFNREWLEMHHFSPDLPLESIFDKKIH